MFGSLHLALPPVLSCHKLWCFRIVWIGFLRGQLGDVGRGQLHWSEVVLGSVCWSSCPATSEHFANVSKSCSVLLKHIDWRVQDTNCPAGNLVSGWP